MAPVLYKMQFNLYTTATLGIEESGRCKNFLSAGTKKSGRCREAAVTGGSTVWPSVLLRNVQLFLYATNVKGFK